METLAVLVASAVLMAPFLWPPVVMIVCYFRGLEDQRWEQRSGR
jgi:hypothetical protein